MQQRDAGDATRGDAAVAPQLAHDNAGEPCMPHVAGYAAVQRALFSRERAAAAGEPARGASIAVSLFDSLAEQMAVPSLQQRYTGTSPTRGGLKHPSICPYGASVSRL